MVAALLLLPAAVLFSIVYLLDTPANPAPSASAIRAPGNDDVHICKPGPWGNMVCRSILIEPLAESMPLDATLNTHTRWFFKAASLQDVSSILDRAGISDPLKAALLGSLSEADGGFMTTPSPDLVIDLSPRTRAMLYQELGRWPQNPTQAKPFRIAPNRVDEWMGDNNLSPDTKALVRKLLYPKGPFLLFADASLVMERIHSPAERKKFLQVVYRQRAVLPKLQIRPDSDTDALVRYWGIRGREHRVRPLIESLKRSGGGEIDAALLLPTFASERLYSYQLDEDTNFRDCNWSTMNFFLNEPDDRFSDPSFISQVVAKDYEPVTGDRLFGDVIILRNSQSGEALHVCNFIADDIVFTKNGGSRFKPWVLMRLPDVVDYYSLNGPIELAAFRMKK